MLHHLPFGEGVDEISMRLATEWAEYEYVVLYMLSEDSCSPGTARMLTGSFKNRKRKLVLNKPRKSSLKNCFTSKGPSSTRRQRSMLSLAAKETRRAYMDRIAMKERLEKAKREAERVRVLAYLCISLMCWIHVGSEKRRELRTIFDWNAVCKKKQKSGCVFFDLSRFSRPFLTDRCVRQRKSAWKKRERNTKKQNICTQSHIVSLAPNAFLLLAPPHAHYVFSDPSAYVRAKEEEEEERAQREVAETAKRNQLLLKVDGLKKTCALNACLKALVFTLTLA